MSSGYSSHPVVGQISFSLFVLAAVNAVACVSLIWYSIQVDIATILTMFLYGLQGTVGSLLLWAVAEALLMGAEVCYRLKSIDENRYNRGD